MISGVGRLRFVMVGPNILGYRQYIINNNGINIELLQHFSRTIYKCRVWGKDSIFLRDHHKLYGVWDSNNQRVLDSAPMDIFFWGGGG